MDGKIKYPVGIQTFSEIINDGYLYVDKTGVLYELANNNKYIFLSRPRRFGKSLLLSTLEAYFQGRKELFGGLAIEELEKDWTVHPVLRFDLSGETYDVHEKIIYKLESYLRRYEEIYGYDPESKTVAERFRLLIENAHKVIGQRVVILIDEYDKPLLDTIHDDDLQEKVRQQLHGFYSVIKECDEHIRFAMLTGVGKFGHVSIFSGLNNLRDISLNEQYNDICGITETEFKNNFGPSVAQFAKREGVTEDQIWNEFKLNYDGYHFSTVTEGIYNPFSVLNACKDEKFGKYWFQSGTPEFLIKLIKKNPYALEDLEGHYFTTEDLSDITHPEENSYALFYQSGYLTIKGYDKETQRYMLGFPNEEVRSGFWNSLYRQYVFKGMPKRTFDIYNFLDEIKAGKAEDFMTRLQALVASISPGVDRGKEVHFQNVMQIIFKMLGLNVKTEVESSNGRCDMTVETPRFVYVFEFKINATAQAALDQIKTKGYARPFMADDRTLYLIGANFSTATAELDSFLIESPK